MSERIDPQACCYRRFVDGIWHRCISDDAYDAFVAVAEAAQVLVANEEGPTLDDLVALQDQLKAFDFAVAS